jgi:hypothetical protein
MGLALALSSLLLLLAEPEVPEVAAPAASLSWSAPPECPGELDVAAVIAVRVAPGTVEIRAVVQHETDGFVAQVEIDSAQGSTRRRLQSPSCTSIVDALALLAQVAAEPLPTLERLAPPPLPLPLDEPEPEPEPEPVPDAELVRAPTPPTPSPRKPANLRARMFATAIVGGGTLPGIDLGVRGGVGLTSRWVHADLGALYLGPRDADDVPANVRVRIDAWGLFARVCPVIPLPLRRLELSVCAVGSAGALRGSASGSALRDPADDLLPWVRLAAAPELAVVLHRRVRLVAGVEIGGHVAGRPAFTIGRPVWRPRPWAVHGLLGVEVRLP